MGTRRTWSVVGDHVSVLHVHNEWPWSYYLMIAAHLALFSLDAGNH